MITDIVVPIADTLETTTTDLTEDTIATLDLVEFTTIDAIEDTMLSTTIDRREDIVEYTIAVIIREDTIDTIISTVDRFGFAPL